MSRARLEKRKGVVSPREAINLVEPKHHMALIVKIAVVLFTVARCCVHRGQQCIIGRLRVKRGEWDRHE